MSAARLDREPYRFSAGMLALLVHGVFFALLYFGFNWQSRQPELMMVEMWDELPGEVMEEAALPEPLPEEMLPPPEKVELQKSQQLASSDAQVRAEIELQDKKAKALKQAELEAEKRKRQEELAAQEAMKREQERQKQLAEQAEREKQKADEERRARQEARIRAEQQRIRAEVDAATRAEVERYKGMIQGKIRRNIVMPPDVAEDAEAKFLVKLLPGGDVLDVVLEQSSGNAAYDSAAERAIYKARPLPVPQDPALSRLFRELRLSVKP